MWTILPETKQINYRQNSSCVKDKDADKPGKLVVSGRVPHADALPNSIPDSKNYKEN
jgi:hypothetical protein